MFGASYIIVDLQIRGGGKTFVLGSCLGVKIILVLLLFQSPQLSLFFVVFLLLLLLLFALIIQAGCLRFTLISHCCHGKNKIDFQ